MHSRIRPPCAYDRDRASAQPGYSCLENTLNRPLTRLPLPAGKARAIVVQHKLHGTRQHRVKLAVDNALGKERNPLKMIDFRPSARQCGTAFGSSTLLA